MSPRALAACIVAFALVCLLVFGAAIVALTEGNEYPLDPGHAMGLPAQLAGCK